MTIKDERLGYIKDGVYHFPEKTIKGRDYQRPASNMGLGGGYFAVLDTFGNEPEEIEELKALVGKGLKPKPKVMKTKVVSEDVQTEDD